MNTIAFEMIENPDSSDHQVRIWIGHEDLISEISDGWLGIDPPEFFSQKELSTNGDLLISRCSCGIAFCGNITIKVVHDENTVIWKGLPQNHHDKKLVFNREQYLQAVKEASNNYDWEPPKRTVARYIKALDMTYPESFGLEFCGTSWRYKDHHLTLLYYIKDSTVEYDGVYPFDYYILSHIPLEYIDPDIAVDLAQKQISTPPNSWQNVEYVIPPNGKKEPPRCAGKSWQARYL